MNPNPIRKDQNYVGYGAYFEGQRLGTVTDDRLRPGGGRPTSRRVVTLDNGMALLDPTSEAAAAEGFILRSPAEEEDMRNRQANALRASLVGSGVEREAVHADHLCLV
jgi:hypothetical protein